MAAKMILKNITQIGEGGREGRAPMNPAVKFVAFRSSFSLLADNMLVRVNAVVAVVVQCV
jgi:hypothetical protein